MGAEGRLGSIWFEDDMSRASPRTGSIGRISLGHSVFMRSPEGILSSTMSNYMFGEKVSKVGFYSCPD